MTRARSAVVSTVVSIVVSIVLVGATLAPMLRSPDRDSFPLSTYPMFAARRPLVTAIDFAYGVTGTGERRTLSPRMLGTREVLQAAAMLDRATAGGPKALKPLCEQIAVRVASEPRFADVATIRIVEGTYDAVEYLVRDAPGVEHDRWRCRVVRGP